MHPSTLAEVEVIYLGNSHAMVEFFEDSYLNEPVEAEKMLFHGSHCGMRVAFADSSYLIALRY